MQLYKKGIIFADFDKLNMTSTDFLFHYKSNDRKLATNTR